MRPELAGKRVVVMGLGRFGGGVGVTRFLARHGANVLVTDQAPADALQASLARLDGLDVSFRLGCHDATDFTGADLIVVNPAVDRRQNPYLQAAQAARVPLTSEIQLLIEHLPDRRRVLGVTGAAGKSTVTAMIGHILRQARGSASVHVGGNLGGSLLESVEQISPEDFVVLELSSFMLELLAPCRWSPHVAVVTTFAPNHLDRHGTVLAYAAAKQQILEHQQQGDVAVLGPGLDGIFTPRADRVVRVAADEAPPPVPDLMPLPGVHNWLNARLAARAVEAAAGISAQAAFAALKSFRGLPHRLQKVCERQDVVYYNDSKSTTPAAAILAITSFPPATVHVILGGYDKGADLTELAAVAAIHSAGVYTLGATGSALAALARAAHGRTAHVASCGTLEAALEAIAARVRRGDVVLLSPGCASTDQFQNYEQRGAAFVQAILQAQGEATTTMPSAVEPRANAFHGEPRR